MANGRKYRPQGTEIDIDDFKKMEVLPAPGECLCEQRFCWQPLMTVLATLNNMKFWPLLAIARAKKKAEYTQMIY